MSSLGWAAPASLLAALRAQALAAARMLMLGARVAALWLSPAAWRAPQPLGRAVARQWVRAAWPLLPWFTLLAALVSVVIVRIVLVTAQSYGLSQLALEVVVRVLVIEIIPMSAAMAVAVRVSVPLAAELAARRRRGVLHAASPSGLGEHIAPRMLAAGSCVLLLAAVASVVALLLAYLMAHGPTPWALERYTRLVGHVFNPVVVLVFGLKTLALAAAVAVVPMGSALVDEDAGQEAVLPHGLVRLFGVMLLMEVVGLAGNYL